MNNSSELLLISLKDFYDQKENTENLMQIIDGGSSISLRLIDWFITNYCKNVKDQNPNYKRLKGIYQDYRSQLKAYKKACFDPFRRRQRLSFTIDQDSSSTSINTTVGQLNFFKWAIDGGVIKFIDEHFDNLEAAMNCHQKQIKRKAEKMSSTEEGNSALIEEVNQITESMSDLDTNSSTIYFD